jgi:hypothetical protein
MRQTDQTFAASICSFEDLSTVAMLFETMVAERALSHINQVRQAYSQNKWVKLSDADYISTAPPHNKEAPTRSQKHDKHLP